MNRPRLSKTGIEYGDYVWNFTSGCGNNTNGICKAGGFRCWAYPITQRFADRYPNGFKPTIYPEALLSPLYLKKPSRILCSFMGDLFWGCSEFNPDRKIHSDMPSGKASITMSLKGWIFTTIKQCPQHTFLFLTKQPQNLAKFSPFPDNCWVGVTITNNGQMIDAYNTFHSFKGTAADNHMAWFNLKKFISFEPLLSDMKDAEVRFGSLKRILETSNIFWVIIGAMTLSLEEYNNSNYALRRGLKLKQWGKKWTVQPDIEWVQEIVEACDKARIPVFLKDNLRKIIPDRQEPFWKRLSPTSNLYYYRQEMPK